MAIIGGNFNFSNDPQTVLENYMQMKGITDEEQAKKELEAQYGKPKRELLLPKRNDLGSRTNLDFLTANGNYAIGGQGVSDLENLKIQKPQTKIEKLLKNAGYENLTEIAKQVGDADVEITYGNNVPCLQLFDENKKCIGHMYMDSFIENGEEQKNKLIIYGNDTNPTVVFKFNDDNKLSQIYDSSGNVKDIPARNSKQQSGLVNQHTMLLRLMEEKAKIEFQMQNLMQRKLCLISQIRQFNNDDAEV